MKIIDYQNSNSIRYVQRSYAKNLKQDYEEIISSLLNEFSSYRRYFITITLRNPNRFLPINEFISDVSEIYDDLLGVISPNTNRDRFPFYLKPILLFGLDTEGSKGSGSLQRYVLSEAGDGSIPNLHAHGLLLLNPETDIQPVIREQCLFTKRREDFPNYEIQYLPFDEERSDRGVSYVTKSIETSGLININFSQMYLFFSKHRDHVTPEGISMLQTCLSQKHKEHENCRVQWLGL